MEKVNALFNKFKHLKQYENYSDEELMEVVRQKLEEYDVDLDVNNLFPDKESRNQAKQLLQKYLKSYTIETISDKNTLKQLIYLEVIHKKLQDKLNEITKLGTQKPIPIQAVDVLHRNLEKIQFLKESLGISKDDASSVENTIQSLKRKFEAWRKNNQASRSLCCPHCGRMVLLKIRTKYWEEQKHPLFKDRILGNKELIRLYKIGKLTVKEVAEVLEVSEDYISWLIKKWGNK